MTKKLVCALHSLTGCHKDRKDAKIRVTRAAAAENTNVSHTPMLTKCIRQPLRRCLYAGIVRRRLVCGCF